MPNFGLYTKLLNSPIHDGDIRKKQSDEIMEETWWEDISSKVAYFYDFNSDIGEEKYQFTNMHPEEDSYKTAVDIKFLYSSSQTFAQEQVTYHLQLRPSFNYKDTSLDYFEDDYAKKYLSIFPVGLYVDIPSEDGSYNRWLVVNTANYYNNQFPTFDILPCNKLLQYVCDGICYQVPGVIRQQNSYNSGLYTNRFETSLEDQMKIIVPLNTITQNLYYNQRLILDSIGIEKDPRTWNISKINRVSPNGLITATMAQDEFNNEKDYIGYDENDRHYLAYADYYSSSISPVNYEKQSPHITYYAEFTYANKNQLKIGGGYKTITLTVYDENGNDITQTYLPSGTFTFTKDGIDISSLLSVDLSANKLKLKFLGDKSHLKDVIDIGYDDGVVSANTQLEIVAL